MKQTISAVVDIMGERLLEAVERPGTDWLPYGSTGLNGFSGIAMALAALSRSRGEERYTRGMHEALRRACSHATASSLGSAMGIAGLRAAAAYAHAVVPSYDRLISQCDRLIDSFQSAPPSSTTSDYDLISGWAGARLSRGPSKEDWLIDRLLWLLSDDAHWRRANPMMPSLGEHNLLGASHGIGGVLAAFALTTDYTHRFQCVLDVARTVAHLWREDQVTWPFSLQDTHEYAPRFTWCYGSAAIAATMRAVGLWAGDAELTEIAGRTMAAMIEAGLDEAINDQAICHGTLGAALICASASTGDSPVRRFADQLVERAIADLERRDAKCTSRSELVPYYEAFGFLDGYAGIVLALCTLVDGTDASWMRLHALRPLS